MNVIKEEKAKLSVFSPKKQQKFPYSGEIKAKKSQTFIFAV